VVCTDLKTRGRDYQSKLLVHFYIYCCGISISNTLSLCVEHIIFASNSKAGEPDFYEISRRYPLPPPPAPTISNSYINVQGDTRPTPKRQKTNHNNIVQQQPGMYNPYGYNPYMMGQQYPGMPGSPSQYVPHQQYHDANMMAYYAQLPYSDPSTIQQPMGYPGYPPAAGYGHYPGYPPQPPHGYPPQPHPGYPPMSPMYPAHQQPPPPAAAAAAAATAAAAAAQPQQQQGSTGHAAQANAQQYETDDDKYEEEDGANDEHEDPRGHKIKGSTPVVHNRQPQADEEGADDERKPAARTDLTRASDQGGVAAHHPPSAGTSARPPYRSPTADYTREDPELTSFFREAAFGNSPPSRTAAAPMQYGGGADPYHSYAQGTAQQHQAAAAPLDIGNYYLPPSSAERARGGHAVQPYPTREEAEQNEEQDPREHQEYQR